MCNAAEASQNAYLTLALTDNSVLSVLTKAIITNKNYSVANKHQKNSLPVSIALLLANIATTISFL